MSGNYDYQTLKQTAKDRGESVKDMLALAAKNDPFYTGSPATVTAAQWFTAIWQQAGYTTGVHLRRVHYWLVNGPLYPVKMPSGETYENTEACWKWLGDAGKYARYLGYISPDAFIDRRNPKPIIYDYAPEDTTPGPALSNWELPDWELPSPPELIATGYEAEQAYSVEIWAEKTTMNDILEPLCKRYGLNLITGAGELSITAVRDLLRRIRKPTRILYVSDFDPAGLGMPVSVARKIEFYTRQMNGSAQDIGLQPVVLTAAQVEAYRLPRIPVKDTDARKGNFEAAHGAGQVELDALEALYPGELASVLENEILNYIDTDLRQAVENAEADYQDELDAATREVHAAHAAELEALTAELGEIAPRYRELKQRVETLYNQIEYELAERVREIDPEPIPQPAPAGDPCELLYNSRRDYFTQLQAYKAHRNGEEI